MKYIALLRGINVGGNRKVEMKRLRNLFESLGYANVVTYSDSGLTSSTTYYYRIRASNPAGNSIYSDVASATTLSSTTIPPNPTGVAATAVSSSQINLAWTDVSGETSYLIERGSTSSTSGFTQIGTTNANIVTYSNTGLSASTTYYYRVRASNSAGNSGYSNVASETTQAAASTGKTYYISPTGGDSNAGTSAAPWKTFQKAYSVMKGGDTLIVKDGTYTSQKVLCRAENSPCTQPPSGTASAYTTIKAENPFGAIIDGQSTSSAIWMNGLPALQAIRYIHIDGFIFKRQKNGAIFYGVDHMKFTRLGIESEVTGNPPAFLIGTNSNYVMVEDVFVWGGGRYKLQCYESSNIIF